jgi:hypothetical protein
MRNLDTESMIQFFDVAIITRIYRINGAASLLVQPGGFPPGSRLAVSGYCL